MSGAQKIAAIIGAGFIGRGWAIAFARAGFAVRLWDGDAQAAHRALAHIQTSLDDMAAVGLVADSASILARVSVAADIEAALRDATWAQESVTENGDVKRQVFAALDAAAPKDAVLASSTSALPGHSFLSELAGRDRCIVAHPANPPHLMPVVEVAPCDWHSPAFVQHCCAILKEIEQVPVLIKKEVIGFVMNRLQSAVVGEAMALVANGVVDPDGIDAIMKHSLGLRWSFIGPFETMDLNAPAGFLDYATRYGETYAKTAGDLTVAAPWTQDAIREVETARRKAVPAGTVEQRQRWRDQRLMRLLKHKSDCDREIGA